MNKWAELVLWVGVGLVLIMLLTSSEVHNLLFSGGIHGTGSTTTPNTGGTPTCGCKKPDLANEFNPIAQASYALCIARCAISQLGTGPGPSGKCASGFVFDPVHKVCVPQMSKPQPGTTQTA